MSDVSRIEWTEATWNPIVGCTAVSPACDFCYAAREASGRLSALPLYAGLAKGGVFTGEVRLVPDRLDQPLRWRRPRRVFVNSMSDLFHEGVPDEFIAKVFAVMAMAKAHTFQVLTKRHGRMRSLLNDHRFWLQVGMAGLDRDWWPPNHGVSLDAHALPNVWIGVSVEDQKWADIRIPALLGTPAAVRWLSCEPLLGPVDLFGWRNGLDWVVGGGESGPKARPMDPAWARLLRDRCVDAGVPFFFKQWGEWGPANWKPERLAGEDVGEYKGRAEATGATHALVPGGHLYEAPHKPWSVERVPFAVGERAAALRRWGKKVAGRELDGRTWDEYPSRQAWDPETARERLGLTTGDVAELAAEERDRW